MIVTVLVPFLRVYLARDLIDTPHQGAATRRSASVEANESAAAAAVPEAIGDARG
jgi:hypothetical protein